MSKRVLIVHNVVAPYRLPVFEALDEEYDITVLFCAAEAPGREWTADLDEYDFDHVVLPGIGLGGVRVNYNLPRHLFGAHFDAAIVSDAGDPLLTSTVVALYARVIGIPYVVWTEVIDPREGREILDSMHAGALKSKALGMVRRALYRGASGFVAYSSLAREYLLSEGVEEESIASGIQVMPESVLGERQERDRRDDTATTVLYVGYLNDRKGVEYLIDAYRRVATEDSRLVIVGTGPAEDRLRSIAGDQEDVEFTGYVSEKRKAAYYAEADVFVLPTLHDAWGLVVNEAMWFGLPIIVTEATGAAELVERHDNGFVVPAGDAGALADRLDQLLDDSELRRRLAERSAAATEVTDVGVAVEPFEVALDRVLEQDG